MKLWCVTSTARSTADYGTPQDVVWLASGTGIFDTGIKNFGRKKNRPPCTRHSGRSFRNAKACDEVFRHAPLRIHGNHCQRLSVFAKVPITVYQTVCEGRPSFDAHQLGTLVIPHPDLLGAGITYAEVIAFKEI